MEDIARSRGIKIDTEKLSELLDVPVVFTIGNKNIGIDNLLQKAIELSTSEVRKSKERRVKYSKDIENAIAELEGHLSREIKQDLPYESRWTAIKILENDKIVRERLLGVTWETGQAVIHRAEQLRQKLIDRYDDDPEIVMTGERYGFIAGIIKEVHTSSAKQRIDISRNIDLVLTNRFVGFPIFIVFIWMMFQLTFSLGAYPMDWIDSSVAWLAELIALTLPDSLLKDLLVNGVIAGVGSVIVFLPNILILFFCIALFEDTGYMARAAFLMDRIMHFVGLHGKSFIPMLMGFGCSVPAIMATRTLESEKDRILTTLITPFMSCSARLPVYIVLAGAFFSRSAGSVIFSIYLVGILLSIITGRLFRSTILRGADAPFVMELPPYRVPMLKSLLIHMWDRSKLFLKRMGGVILIGSVVVWGLSSFPRNISYTLDYDAELNRVRAAYASKMETVTPEDRSGIEKARENAIRQLIVAQKAEQAEKSFMGQIGKVLSPVFEPIGIDWRGSVALLTGFFAKEIVVSTLGILYVAEAEDESSDELSKALLSSGMTPLSALAMMLFVLLYVPCLATVTTIKRELNSYKWTAVNIVYSTVLAWLAAFVVYQGGSLMGF
jgi:ferrous iron transport protein B